jgi:hypothetical protein
MVDDLKIKLEGFLQIINLISGTKIVNDSFLFEELLAEYKTEQLKFDPDEEKTINISDYENIVTLYISVLEGTISIKFEAASDVYIPVVQLALAGSVPALIVKAGSVGAKVKLIIATRKV